MGHALTNTAACAAATQMAIHKAKLGAGSKVIGIRRKAWDSYDLAFVVEAAKGECKEVTVTHSSLKRRLALESNKVAA